MLTINKYLKPDEEIIYKLEKKKNSIFFILVFLPFLIIICYFLFIPCFANCFLGKISFDSDETYIINALMMFTFVPLITIFILNHISDTLIITNKRIYIRKAISGSLKIIELRFIKSYKFLEENYKGAKSYYVEFLLYNNKYYKTSNLSISEKSLRKLTRILDNTIKRPQKLKRKDKLIKKEPVDCYVIIYKNYLLSAIYFAPFFISIVMFILLISGFNYKVGIQTDFEISGVIEKRVISHNQKSNSTTYTIALKEKNSSKVYDIEVDENIFNMFSEGDNALVQAKKGSLGIVYDEVFFKE